MYVIRSGQGTVSAQTTMAEADALREVNENPLIVVLLPQRGYYERAYVLGVVLVTEVCWTSCPGVTG